MCFKNYISEEFQAAICPPPNIKCEVCKVHCLLLILALRESQQGDLKMSRGCCAAGQAMAWQGPFLIPADPPAPLGHGPDTASAFCMLWWWHLGTGTPLWCSNCAS